MRSGRCDLRDCRLGGVQRTGGAQEVFDAKADGRRPLQARRLLCRHGRRSRVTMCCSPSQSRIRHAMSLARERAAAQPSMVWQMACADEQATVVETAVKAVLRAIPSVGSSL